MVRFGFGLRRVRDELRGRNLAVHAKLRRRELGRRYDGVLDELGIDKV